VSNEIWVRGRIPQQVLILPELLKNSGVHLMPSGKVVKRPTDAHFIKSLK